jgi:lysophospholipase L1-like esterase
MNNLSKPIDTPSLLIIGDSITLGAAEVRGSEIVDYVQPTCIDLLKSAFPQVDIRIDAAVRRNSVSVKDEIDSIIARHAPHRVMLMIGGSDCDMDWKRFILSEGQIARSRVPVDRYEKNMRLICQKLLAAGATPILTDLPNHHLAICGPYVSALCGKDITPLITRGGGQAESDKHLVHYRQCIAGLSRELNLDLIRYGEALDNYPAAEVLSRDGTHPSAAGHRVIAAAMIAAMSQPACAAAAEMTA